MKNRPIALIAALLLAAGCSSTGGGSGASGSSGEQGATGSGGDQSQAQQGGSGTGATVQGSGFMGNYSQLKPAPDREGALLYLDRSQDLRAYHSVMFDPVQVIVTPGPDAAQIDPAVKQRMGEDILNAFRKELSPTYTVVNAPGPHVLRIRTAITGIEAAKPDMTAKDWLPVIAVYNLAAGKRVAEMKGEMEVLDANGKRVAAAVVTRKGDEKLPQGEKVTWSEMSAIATYWAKNLRQRLDELRGETGTKTGAP
jgi:hypothetical protein